MGDENSTTGVQTADAADADAADAGAADTVLTAPGNAGDNVNSDASADAPADDAATADADAGDTDAEGGDGAIETYADFAMPEDMQLDKAVLSEATPMFKELGLNQEQAQKVVDFYAKQVQAGEQNTVDAFNQLKTEWRTAAENDKEFGGDKFDENVGVAQNAVNKFGTSELKQLLTDHGIGNHPEMVRFMVRVGHTLREDVPGKTGNANTTVADRVSILYPNET